MPLTKRIACIDLGTNAIRFIIYEFRSLEDYQVLYKHRAIVRLGHGVFSKGELSPEVLGKIPTILFEYQNKARQMQVEKVCCAATSAVREASNGEKFLQQVGKETGLKFRSLTGMQEARILALALQWNKPAPRNLIYAGVDIGGGSTEVFWYHDQGFIDGISMPIGTVRVLEHFCRFPLTQKEVEKIRRFVQANSNEFDTRRGTMIPHRVFGISGLLHCIFDLMRKTYDEPIHFTELEGFIASNLELTPNELQDRYAIERNRAEILLPGCIILSQLMATGGFRQVYRAEVGLRDGMAFEAMIGQGASFMALNKEKLTEATISWAYGMLDKYAGDLAHAQFVEAFARQVFSKMIRFSQLKITPNDIVLLRCASILHDIGHFISYTKHHAHSQYIIEHSQSPFFTDRETKLVGLLAFHHRKKQGFIDRETFEAMGFSESDYRVFRLNVVVLRISDALDKQHRQLVGFQDLVEKDDGYELHVEASDPEGVSEEIRVFAQAADLFRQVFERPIKLVVNTRPSFH